MRAGWVNGAERGSFAIPSNLAQTSYWCADPNATVDGGAGTGNDAADDGVPIPLMQCGQYGSYILGDPTNNIPAAFPPCPAGGNVPGGNCMMPN
jgi:hypothetical protein